MKIMIFEHDVEPYVTEIGEELENMNEVVGGLIEPNYISDKFFDMDIRFVGDEEGNIKGKLPSISFVDDNRKVLGNLVGKCFAVGIEGNDFSSLTEEQIDFIKKSTTSNSCVYESNGKTYKSHEISIF